MNDKGHRSSFGQAVSFFGGIAVLLIAAFVVFCVIVEFHDYAPLWANAAAPRRALALMIYFTFTVIATVGLLICIAVDRLIGG